MVQFLSIIFFLGFLQFLLGFSKVPVFVSPCIIIEHNIDRTRLVMQAVVELRWLLLWLYLLSVNT